jgi:hypothetical protein
MRHRYGNGPMPGPGDPETWGPVTHPSDPRYEPPCCRDCREELGYDEDILCDGCKAERAYEDGDTDGDE